MVSNMLTITVITNPFMKLTNSQIKSYLEDGFVLIPHLFTPEEIQHFISEISPLSKMDGPQLIKEKDNLTVRALMGCHFYSELYRELVCQPRLLGPVTQLLESDAYVYQFKINLKAAFGGEIWPWHQDFVYWNNLDGMPNPRAVNVTVFLDDCTEFNGPLWVIPGSHNAGIYESGAKGEASSDWSTNVSADLTFKLDQPTIERLVANRNIVSTKGVAGSVLIFHPNIVHASLPNISPFERKLMIITYNSILNIPNPKITRRPAFLVNPDTTAEVERNTQLLTR